MTSMDQHIMWIPTRRQLLTSWVLHLGDTSVNYYNKTGGTEWAHQETEMSVERTAYLLMI